MQFPTSKIPALPDYGKATTVAVKELGGVSAVNTFFTQK
jgi:hypothetical protein